MNSNGGVLDVAGGKGELAYELLAYGRIKNITIVDPKVDRKKALEEMRLNILLEIPENEKYSIIIFGLFHEDFDHLSHKVLKKSTKNNTVIIDLTNKIIGKNVIHL